MEQQRVVAIYGKGLVMSAIGTILQGNMRFQVHHFEQELPVSNTSGGPCPNVILYDLATAPPDLAISLRQKHPASTLIGVDLKNHKMLVLSGEQSRFLTEEDLLQAIEGGAS